MKQAKQISNMRQILLAAGAQTNHPATQRSRRETVAAQLRAMAKSDLSTALQHPKTVIMLHIAFYAICQKWHFRA